MESNFIHPTATLFEGKVILGKNVYIGAGCTIGGPPEHAKVDPLKPESYSVVIIGDNVRIMNGVNIDAGYQRPTEIKDGCIIMAHSHVGHDVIIEEQCTISSGAILGGHSLIKRNANIGINATLHQFTEVGEGTIVGAGCFAKGVLDPWSKYHTKNSAKNQGANTHAIERVKSQMPRDYNY